MHLVNFCAACKWNIHKVFCAANRGYKLWRRNSLDEYLFIAIIIDQIIKIEPILSHLENILFKTDSTVLFESTVFIKISLKSFVRRF